MASETFEALADEPTLNVTVASEVENLQRRIEKLTSSLDQTEHRLRQVAAMKDIDDGISSIYREVQGLKTEDNAFGKKKELMSAIFEANMRLQKKTGQ